MSTKVSSWVWEHSKARGTARVLMLKLADSANDDGWCWPGKGHLEEKCLIDERNIRLLVKKLESMGELYVRHRRRDANRNDTNIYRILMAGGGGSYDHPVEDRTITQVEDRTITQVEDRTITQTVTKEPNTKQPSQNASNSLEPIQCKTTPEGGNSVRDVFPDGKRQPPEQAQKPIKNQKKDGDKQTASEASINSPFRREPDDLRPYAEPLADADNEALAMRLVALAQDLKRENARMLVDFYGLSAVYDAINLFYYSTTKIRHPGGWIRKLLQRNVQTEWQELQSISALNPIAASSEDDNSTPF